jgi:hypothetical protein
MVHNTKVCYYQVRISSSCSLILCSLIAYHISYHIKYYFMMKSY